MNSGPETAAHLAGSSRLFLVFIVGGQRCALPIESVREILPMASLSRLPAMPHSVEGVLNVGGELHAVLRLDRLFGLPENPLALFTPLIVLSRQECPLALLVEKVERLLNVSTNAVLPIRNQSFNECVAAEVAIEGTRISLLSVERLFLAEERHRLMSFQAIAQRRLLAKDGVGQ